MKKLTAWAKSHRIAAGFIGCGGLIVVGFVLLIVIGLILMATGYEVEEEPQAAPTSQVPTQEPTPSPQPTTQEPTPEPERTTEEPETQEPEPEPTTAAAEEDEPQAADSLAQRVEEEVLGQAMVDSFQDLGADSPAWAITEIEDISTGTIRAHVQDAQTDDQAEQTARWLMNMSCHNIEELTTVVVRDTSGVDRNHFVWSVNPPTICN